jgi:hypothetical protein
MRAVKAKQFRRAAERATVGQPDVAYEWATEMVMRRNKDGKEVRVQVGHVVLKDNCTRKVYQTFKQSYREMLRGY